jgi:hypothetical protein
MLCMSIGQASSQIVVSDSFPCCDLVGVLVELSTRYPIYLIYLGPRQDHVLLTRELPHAGTS